MRNIRVFCSIISAVRGTAAWLELVFVAKVRYLGIGGIMGGSSYFVIKFLGAATTDTVRDEGDEDGKDNQANDSKYTCYCTFVVKESRIKNNG